MPSGVATAGCVDDRAVGETEDVGQATVPVAPTRLAGGIAPAPKGADALTLEKIPGCKGALPVDAAMANVNHAW